MCILYILQMPSLIVLSAMYLIWDQAQLMTNWSEWDPISSVNLLYLLFHDAGQIEFRGNSMSTRLSCDSICWLLFVYSNTHQYSLGYCTVLLLKSKRLWSVWMMKFKYERLRLLSRFIWTYCWSTCFSMNAGCSLFLWEQTFFLSLILPLYSSNISKSGFLKQEKHQDKDK